MLVDLTVVVTGHPVKLRVHDSSSLMFVVTRALYEDQQPVDREWELRDSTGVQLDLSRGVRGMDGATLYLNIRPGVGG